MLSFDGIVFPGVGCNCAPPDTDGEVGATQYVQMVNEGFQVFNKSDRRLGATARSASRRSGAASAASARPTATATRSCSTISSPTAGSISQFAGTSVPTDECIAVSTTSDATGT